MHSENLQRSAASRANSDFLRQLVGGDLFGSENNGPHAWGSPSPRSTEPRNRPLTNGATCCPFPCREERSQPPCDQGDGCGVGAARIPSPALAMVYSPQQGWDGLLEPEQALAHGSQFAALILPLEDREGYHKSGRCSK